MYNKFDQIWSKLEVKDSGVKKACAENLKKMSWLLYLMAKYEIFEKDSNSPCPSMLQLAFLIVAVI